MKAQKFMKDKLTSQENKNFKSMQKIQTDEYEYLLLRLKEIKANISSLKNKMFSD